MTSIPKSRTASRDRLNPRKTDHAYYVLRELRRHVADFTGTLTGRELLLDYGCGAMPYRPLFEGRVAGYVGADLKGNPEAELVLDPDGTVPAQSGSFDVVLSSQVLEHVEDPMAYLAEAMRLLRPGGVLVLSTHGSWRYHPHPEDYWRWTASGLRKILCASGFEVRSLRGVLGPLATATQLWQDAALPRLPRRLRKPFTRLLQLAIAAQERWTPESATAADACVYFVVATKPIGEEGRAVSEGKPASRPPATVPVERDSGLSS